ncbi:MAG TPA: Flp pilus assembly protein CpaB [Candidatus Limnocylindrales bacterium]|nr:Flp pilus assembly protein CpaB [Candidatus Limnocylindrales bacterium]
MELEYKDDGRRGRFIVVIGLILAVIAGGAAFYLVSQAQQQASATVATTPAVVAVRAIPARKPIEAADVVVRDVPIDPTNASGIVADPNLVVGRLPVVTILEGQLVSTNLLASSDEGGQFSILGPEEAVTSESIAWRAVSITAPDDRAVGGLLEPGQTVDVFVTATVNVPEDLLDEGKFYTDKSTKVAYQDMLILAKSGQFYVLKAPLDIAEEISHLQASGTAAFSLALRPEVDTRQIDVEDYGNTTNRFITKYGLPVPETYPAGNGPVRTPPPLASPTPFPSPAPSVEPSPVP